MASGEAYFQFIMEQLSALEEVSVRRMMGEYIIYYRGRIVGGVYDDRLLVKPTPSARRLLPDAPLETPYEGAKAMLLVDRLDDADFLAALLRAMWPELPAPRRKS